jgi:ribonuclease D
LIQTQRHLEKYIETIIHDSSLAIDTEFKRVDTYYPELCLVQIATTHSIECIDVLSIDNLEPLFEKLYNKKTLWIAHSVRQDIEALFKLSKRIPNALFDTQIAASLLNYPVQISYQALTEELQGVRLKKDHTRFDWTIRPLPKSVLDYALDDVRYLIPNYRKLLNELKLNNKIQWQEEDSGYLLDPILYDLSTEQIWHKTKGISHLSKKHQEEAMKLVAWREKNAKEKNIPRKWLMADDKLIDYACGKNKLSENLKNVLMNS